MQLFWTLLIGTIIQLDNHHTIIQLVIKIYIVELVPEHTLEQIMENYIAELILEHFLEQG